MKDIGTLRRLDEAKIDYFNGKFHNMEELAFAHDLPLSMVKNAAYVGNKSNPPWAREKRELQEIQRKEAMHASKGNLASIFRNTSELVIDLLSELRKDLIHKADSIDPEKKAKMVKELLKGWHEVFADYRLMENQSTQNIAVKSQPEKVKEAWKTLEELGLDGHIEE